MNKDNKKILKFNRRKNKKKIELRNKKRNFLRKQNYKKTRRIFLKTKSNNNLKQLLSVIGKLSKVNMWHQNKASRMQSKYQKIMNDNE